MSATQSDVTLLVESSCEGDPDAPDRLLPLVYAELRSRAQALLAAERPNHTLQATALVHEAYVRLVDQKAVNWKGKAHFCAVAATAMRRVLVDYARARGRIKRGGGAQAVTLDSEKLAGVKPEQDLIALNDSLDELATFDARKARVIELRFFGGLTIEEAAEVLGVSPRTVRGDWSLAKAWLYRQMTGSPLE